MTDALLGADPAVRARAMDPAQPPAPIRGPFHPINNSAGLENDLVTVSVGWGVTDREIINIVGQSLDEKKGRAPPGVHVEIWQVKGYGRCHHSGHKGH